jgi:hypothetical protein
VINIHSNPQIIHFIVLLSSNCRRIIRSETMTFNYNKVLIIGATSGIGKALAARVAENNIPIVITGRREGNLKEFVDQYGSDKVKSKVFDVTKLDQVTIPSHSCSSNFLSSKRPVRLTSTTDPPVRIRNPRREPRHRLHLRKLRDPASIRLFQTGNC